MEPDSDLAYLIGALRDGSIYYYKKNRSYYVLYYQKYKSWLEQSIGRRIKALFNVNYRIDEYKKGHFRLRLSNKKLYHLFRNDYEFPVEEKTQINWTIPKKIWNASNEVKISYVRGFFDTEGDVSPNSSNTKYIGISQKNIKVLKEIKSILTELGIYTSKEHIIDRKSKTYRISIIGKKNIKKFYSIVGSEHPIKKKNIQLIIKE